MLVYELLPVIKALTAVGAVVAVFLEEAAMLVDRHLPVIATLAAVAAVYVVIRQEKQMIKALRAEAYAKLVEDWRSQELYSQVLYIHDLWARWKKDWGNSDENRKSRNPDGWGEFMERRAREWVEENRPTDPERRDQVRKEWNDRRAVSQLLSKLGPMIANGYFRADDVFGVVPECGRLLAVLIPIEREIQKTFEAPEHNGPPIGAWDFPFPKWEFTELWDKYLDWFKGTGRSCRTLNPINWNDTRVGLILPQTGGESDQ
jgi:hypothetical protein